MGRDEGERGGASSSANGSARLATDHLVGLFKSKKIDEIHLVGHSAGSIFLAPVAQRLAAGGAKIKSLTLWAPACTVALFNETYRPLIEDGTIESFDLFILDDATEQDDDCAQIYHKSLLYLVSHAFEENPRIPFSKGKDGEPILGLQVSTDAKIPAGFWTTGKATRHLSPGATSKALHHGAFDNDATTLLTTLKLITGEATGAAAAQAAKAIPTKSTDSQRQFRQKLDITLRR